MKTRSYLLLLVIMLMTFTFVYAQSSGSIWGYGVDGGIAVGDNAGADEDLSPNLRAYMQLGLMNQLLTRFGVSYVPIEAKNVYSTQLVVGDIRFLFRPIQSQYVAPFLYAGVGASKDAQSGSSPLIAVIPFGIGIQSQISPKVALEVSGGYTLAISDKLDDGRLRAYNDLNRITNKKHDGFFGLTVGLLFTNPYVKEEPAPVVVVVPVKEPEINPNTIDTDGDGIFDGIEVSKYKTNPKMADTDMDGLSDGDEIDKYKTNPLIADTDGDGLKDGDEITQYKTDPNKADTDMDGLNDGDEINKYRTNPLNADTDGDGLKDGVEVMQYKTDPLKADTDMDGLNDYAEVNTHHTDPLNIDTDGGGLNDGAEIKAGKNPLNPADDSKDMSAPKVVAPVAPPVVVTPPKPDMSKIDTDGDGLMDVDEVQKYRTDINKKDTDGDGLSDGDEVMKYRTDPLVADTDKDGISDGLEINQYKTDPLKADTDGDGLDDYAEIMTHRTNPLKIDTDGGSMNDGAEIKFGKNPLDPKDDLLDMTKGKKVVLEGIMFESAKATIRPESKTILTKVYESLQANPDVTVIIAGHTDSVGGEDSNRSLSLRRAQAVKDWLVDKGVDSARIKVIGKGEAEPIASNDTSDGRAKNRRIEFEIEK
ncbi:MAG: hypothetical protein CVU50_06565 [Candidatus Cloacimonetes bacterium HGW-Cloacimonetes-3]|jgi:outer membrane protein OmpA-like peptidoglycan-associated protein|nr:MAG: hypothetical protein CVU50_06565 [Candidatus Cloacimonetes bacterium HGW-Cloacimonetes-3]